HKLRTKALILVTTTPASAAHPATWIGLQQRFAEAGRAARERGDDVATVLGSIRAVLDVIGTLGSGAVDRQAVSRHADSLEGGGVGEAVPARLWGCGAVALVCPKLLGSVTMGHGRAGEAAHPSRSGTCRGNSEARKGITITTSDSAPAWCGATSARARSHNLPPQPPTCVASNGRSRSASAGPSGSGSRRRRPPSWSCAIAANGSPVPPCWQLVITVMTVVPGGSVVNQNNHP